MKSILTAVAGLFAVSAFAKAPAKKEEAKPAAAPAKKEEKKAEPAKKDDKKAEPTKSNSWIG